MARTKFRSFAPQDIGHDLDPDGREFTVTSWKTHAAVFASTVATLTGAPYGYSGPLVFDGTKVTDAEAASVAFSVGATELTLPLVADPEALPWHHGDAGTVGRLTITHEGWWFEPYLDQTLVRAPELDRLARSSDVPGQIPNVVGWRNKGKPEGFLAPIDFLPGANGEFVPDTTVPVVIKIPAEFARECSSAGLSAEQVLQGFIADLAGLHNFVKCPRVDGYSSNGSDERDMAEAWFDRAYGMLREEAEFRLQQEEELAERRVQELEERDERNDAIDDLYREFVDGGHGDHQAFLAVLDNSFPRDSTNQG